MREMSSVHSRFKIFIEICIRKECEALLLKPTSDSDMGHLAEVMSCYCNRSNAVDSCCLNKGGEFILMKTVVINYYSYKISPSWEYVVTIVSP